MNQIQAQHIMQAAQSLCGIVDLLYESSIAKDLGEDAPELAELAPHTEGHLLTAAKHLAHQLNGDTENLADYDLVKREDN